MDRPIVYAGELPRSADFLGLCKDALYAIGDVLAAVLGTDPCVHGLNCAPTAPASLQVTVGAGAIYAQETVDATAYAGMGIDANTIVKQGLLISPATLTLTPPLTSGYSQVYLIQAAYNDSDQNSIALPYYNSNNPAQPLSGPNNSGTAQFTVRAGLAAVALKAGTAAPTGSQVTPIVDAGYVALYTITLTNGQTAINSGNIVLHPSAPFIGITLPQVPKAIQQQLANYAVDAGSANAIAVTLPPYTALVAGLTLRVKKANYDNTGGITVTVNGGSAISATFPDGTALIKGDWPANELADMTYDGVGWRIKGPIGPGSPSFAHSGSQSFLNSTTWTVPPNVYRLTKVRVWGAGGGGGGSSGVNQSSSGGGGGGYTEASGVDVTPGQVITVTIGAGGAGGVGLNYGGDGGDSTFGSTVPVTATGGTGGSYNSVGVQGVGGAGSVWQVTAQGHSGNVPSFIGGVAIGGQGGQAPFSSGVYPLQAATTAGLDGGNGAFPGGGGNGACTGSSTSSHTGGDGNDGYIEIQY